MEQKDRPTESEAVSSEDCPQVAVKSLVIRCDHLNYNMEEEIHRCILLFWNDRSRYCN